MADLTQPPVSELSLPLVLAALGDPIRLAIVAEIDARGDVVCGTLHVPVAKSTLSHHLKVLREAGVTDTRMEGVERHVTLRRRCLDARFPGLLSSVIHAACETTGRENA